MAELRDDGTMDTVIACEKCGEEARYNWDGETGDDGDYTYDDFVSDSIDDFDSEHECLADDDEPNDDDIVTEDHRTFRQYSRVVFVVEEVNIKDVAGYEGRHLDGRVIRQPATNKTFFPDVESVIRAYQDETKFWVNVFFVSDHGNWHRIEL